MTPPGNVCDYHDSFMRQLTDAMVNLGKGEVEMRGLRDAIIRLEAVMLRHEALHDRDDEDREKRRETLDRELEALRLANVRMMAWISGALFVLQIIWMLLGPLLRSLIGLPV